MRQNEGLNSKKDIQIWKYGYKCNNVAPTLHTNQERYGAKNPDKVQSTTIRTNMANLNFPTKSR